jgi:aminotransferase
MEHPEWTFTAVQLEQAVTEKTKAIVVNSPGNPSGKVWTRDQLETVAAIATKHDLFVFSDEIYEYFLYDGRSHLSMAALPGMAERTITVGGYSKTFSVTGWRIGYSVAARPWAQAIGAVNDLLYVCAPAPLQMGIAAGIIELPDDFYKELARSYQRKRDRFCKALAEAGLTPSIPDGAYYVLADVSKVPGSTGKARAMALLEATGVAGVPGEAFFSSTDGSRFIRFSYAKTDEALDEACRRLKRAKF